MLNIKSQIEVDLDLSWIKIPDTVNISIYACNETVVLPITELTKDQLYYIVEEFKKQLTKKANKEARVSYNIRSNLLIGDTQC